MPAIPNKLTQFWQEFRRRKVLPFLIAYIAACFAIIEFLTNTSERYSIPDTTVDLIYILAAIGLPIVIVLPWFINRKKAEAISDNLRAIQSNAKLDKSIIVLPFDNISPDPDQEYFSDGLTEEIIADLSYINDLLVISRSSSMVFKGTRKTIKEIAEEVNVKYVLEGSVRKAGNDLRIVAQLIDASSDSHLWAEKYSGTLDDIFIIQEKVSSSIADALKIKLTSDEKQKMYDIQIGNSEVYDLYIKAQRAMNTLTEIGLKQAIQYVSKGLGIIGDNDKLHAFKGMLYLTSVELGFNRDKSIFAKVEECTERVFSLNPGSSDGHYLRGHVKRWHGDVIGSIKDYNQALSIEANHFWANLYRIMNYGFSGHGQMAIDSVSKLLQTDPLNPFSYFAAGMADVFLGRFDQAHDYLQKAFEMEPNPFYGWWLSYILAHSNRIDEAYKLMDQFSDMADDVHWAKIGVIFKHALEGEEDKVLELYTLELKNLMRGDEFYSVWVAESYALINHNEEAIEWLEIAVNNQFINYPFLTKHDRFLKNLHNEEGFINLMKRVKKEWEDFKV